MHFLYWAVILSVVVGVIVENLTTNSLSYDFVSFFQFERQNLVANIVFDVQTITHYGKSFCILWVTSYVLTIIAIIALAQGKTRTWRLFVIIVCGLLPAELFTLRFFGPDTHQIIVPALRVATIASIFFWMQPIFHYYHSNLSMQFSIVRFSFYRTIVIPALLVHTISVAWLCMFFASYYWSLPTTFQICTGMVSALFVVARIVTLQPLVRAQKQPIQSWFFELPTILIVLLWVAGIVALTWYLPKIYPQFVAVQDITHITMHTNMYWFLFPITTLLGISLGIFVPPSNIVLWVAMIFGLLLHSQHAIPSISQWFMHVFMQIVIIAYIVHWGVKNNIYKQYQSIMLVNSQQFTLWLGLIYKILPWVCVSALVLIIYTYSMPQQKLFAIVCAIAVGVSFSRSLFFARKY